MPSLALLPQNRLKPFFEGALSNVRYEILENCYVEEALAALSHGLHRSAILNLWCGVVDDLRNKVIFRSAKLFSKVVKLGREIKTYEDMQDHVTDDVLIDGACKIGVIGWEARKVLKQAKDTRNIFAGHPRSTQPSVFKTGAMFEDCIKYVLAVPFPDQVIDLDDYLAVMATPDFDRNEIAIKSAMTELPEIYTTQFINRLFTTYIDDNSGSDLRSNIELVAPILWRGLSKDLKRQVARRVDQVINDGNAVKTKDAFKFVRLLRGSGFLSSKARSYVIEPLVDRLRENLDNWKIENTCVTTLVAYASIIPSDLVTPYVWAITHTYVGYMASSGRWNRRDYYADLAALRIPKMFEVFDDSAAAAFVDCLRKSSKLRDRARSPEKMQRLRSLGKIVRERVSDGFSDKKLLNALVDPNRDKEYWQLARREV